MNSLDLTQRRRSRCLTHTTSPITYMCKYLSETKYLTSSL